MSFLTRAKRRNIPEEGILHNYSRENLKSYTVLNSDFHEWREIGKQLLVFKKSPLL
jgi:hypothetical protein